MPRYDIAGVSTEVDDRQGPAHRIADTLLAHYAAFESAEVKDPELIVKLGNYTVPGGKWSVSGGRKFLMRKDGLAVEAESHKGARWRFLMDGLGTDKLVVLADSNVPGRMFLTGNVVDFAIHERLLYRGTPMIHAASVVHDGGAILLAGRGGAGKTTLSSTFLEGGASFLSDNYTVLDGPLARGFPTSLSLFSYNLTPQMEARLSGAKRRELRMKKALYRASSQYVKLFTKVDPRSIYGSIMPSAPIRTVVLLRPTMGIPDPSLEEMSAGDAAARTLANQMLEFPHFNRYLAEHRYAYPTARIGAHWEEYATSLELLFKKLNVLELRIDPRRLRDARHHVCRLIERAL